MGENEKKLGLALGGGGARGAAHIGVFMELEQLGLKPDIVVGTSIGGLVGALIAAGLKSGQLIDVFEQMQFQQNQTLLAIQKELEILASQTEDEFERSYLTMAAMAELTNNP